MILPRSRLLARFAASDPRLIELCAPAGYGKSTLAQLVAKRFSRHGVCDCAGVCGIRDFAARALSALADESQDSDDMLAATRLRLHATEADEATWRRALIEAWKARAERALFIFENTDALANNASVLELLGDLLAARPSERVILLCSNAPAALRTKHYVAPHLILSLTRTDLRFDESEAVSIFEPLDVAPEIAERIIALAEGWPIALPLLARFADYEPNIEQLLDALDRVPFEQLYRRLAHDVLASLTPDMMATLLATAAIPHASLEDIAAATGIKHPAPIVDGLLRLPGFVSAERARTYKTHPLLHELLRARHASDFVLAVQSAAHAAARTGDFMRAAELYIMSGDEPSAAAALNRLPSSALASPPSRLIDALLQVDPASLCAHPGLWIAMFPYRRRHCDPAALYDEATILLGSMPTGSSPSLHRRMRLRLAVLATELHRLAETRSLLRTPNTRGSLEEAPEERRLHCMTLALAAAKEGRFAQSEELVEEGDAIPSDRHARFDDERAQIAFEKAYLLGEWHELLKLSEESLAAAHRSGITEEIVAAARASGRAAWYCNDDSRVRTAQQLIMDCGRPASTMFSPCERRLQAALETGDIERAADLFATAVAESDALGDVFQRIMVRAATALLLPAQRHRLIEARDIAGPIESPPLKASLELLVDSLEPADYGIFHHLALRIARSALKVVHGGLFVDVARGEVRRGAQPVHLSDRGLELIVALALLPAGTTKEILAASLWPEHSADHALNTLKMCVHRTRTQLADKEAIRSTKRGYSLSEDVRVDVREFERLLRRCRSMDILGASVRRRLQDGAAALAARRTDYAKGWKWFDVHARALGGLHEQLVLAGENDALKAHRRRAPAAEEHRV